MVIRGPFGKTLCRSQVCFDGRGRNPADVNFFFVYSFCFFSFVTFPPIVLSLLSRNFYQTVRHSLGDRSCDIAPDNPRGYFVAWWEHLKLIRMWMGEWCFASEFSYCGHPIVWRLVWKSIGSWSMQTKCPRRNRALHPLLRCCKTIMKESGH